MIFLWGNCVKTVEKKLKITGFLRQKNQQGCPENNLLTFDYLYISIRACCYILNFNSLAFFPPISQYNSSKLWDTSNNICDLYYQVNQPFLFKKKKNQRNGGMVFLKSTFSTFTRDTFLHFCICVCVCVFINFNTGQDLKNSTMFYLNNAFILFFCVKNCYKKVNFV